MTDFRATCRCLRRAGAATLVAAVLCIAPRADPKPVVKKGVTTSDACGDCHKDIYRMWRASAHAKSMEDPVFVSGWKDATAREGEAVSRRCLRCHAPLAELTADSGLKQRVTWEGVNCDVCHSLVSVDHSQKPPKMVFDIGEVKRGPIKDAVSMAHEVAYSPLHQQSLVCAGCHEYTTPEGTEVISTWSEWVTSSASKDGRTCQSCHMATTRANVVDPKVKRVRADVNLHEVPGGHSLDQLHKALGVNLQTRREGEALTVQVDLKNKGAGHAVPTGMPGRKVWLEVSVGTDGGKSFQEKRVYTRSFEDAQGQPITRDSRYFSPGAKQVGDTRIRPDEKRTEKFRFEVPSKATAFVTVALQYEHAPSGGPEDRTWITFQSEKRTVLPAGGKP